MERLRWLKHGAICILFPLGLCLYVLASAPAAAQTGCGTCECDSLHQLPYVPGQWARIIYTPKDTGSYSISDMRDPKLYLPVFYFEYQSDSGDVRIQFADVRKNGQHMPLHGWCYDKAWNWDDSAKVFIDEVSDAQLGERSRSRWIPVSVGDTLQVYRDVLLFDHTLRKKLLWDRWKAADDIAFSIEVVDSASNSRVALIDTFFVFKSSSNGRPAFASWYPTAAIVKYVVPYGTPADTKMALRIRVFALNGDGERFTRSDIMKYDPAVMMEAYTGVWKVMTENNPLGQSGSCPPFTSTLTGSLQLSAPSVANAASVAVLTPYGQQLASFSMPQLSTSPSVSLISGPYIVAVRNNQGLIVCTELVYVP
jgi:hypothetical protein